MSHRHPSARHQQQQQHRTTIRSHGIPDKNIKRRNRSHQAANQPSPRPPQDVDDDDDGGGGGRHIFGGLWCTPQKPSPLSLSLSLHPSPIHQKCHKIRVAAARKCFIFGFGIHNLTVEKFARSIYTCPCVICLGFQRYTNERCSSGQCNVPTTYVSECEREAKR